jgi:hypothetical protein
MKPRSDFLALLVALVFACWLPRMAGAAACPVGDLRCACHAAGGVWKNYRRPLEPLCTFTVYHQGGEVGDGGLKEQGMKPHTCVHAWATVNSPAWPLVAA